MRNKVKSSVGFLYRNKYFKSHYNYRENIDSLIITFDSNQKYFFCQ